MSAFDLSREAAAGHDRPTDTAGGAEAVIQAGEFIIRESGSAWISTESPAEVIE
jgi:hypothetical protein